MASVSPEDAVLDQPIARQPARRKERTKRVSVLADNPTLALQVASWQAWFLLQVEVARQIFSILAAMLPTMEFWLTGHPIVYFGLFFSFLCEIFSHSPQYNTTILITIFLCIGYFETMLPQLMIFLIFIGSFILDCAYFAETTTDKAAKGLTALVLIAKITAIYLFLEHDSCKLTKKYILRRAGVFGVYWKDPIRIHREIRSRTVALGIVQVIGFILFLTTFFMSITSLSNALSAPVVGIYFYQFLIVKCLSIGVVIIAIFWDADLILCCAHFGLFGCYMSYIRQYIRQRESDTGRYPVIYTIVPGRFNVITFLKLIDFIWGVVGWVTLSNLFGVAFNSARTDVKAFSAIIGFALALADCWGVVLLVQIRQLLSTRNLLVENGDSGYDTDDSEIYELRLKSFREGPQFPAAGERRRQAREVQDEGDEYDLEDGEEEELDADELMGDAFAAAPPAKQAFVGSARVPGEEIEVSRGASRDQFATTRRFNSTDRVSSFTAPPERRRSSVVNPAPEALEPRIALDSSSTLTGKAFTEEWNIIEDSRELNCGFSLPPSVNIDKLRTSDITPFIKYLRSMGLQIVASGIRTLTMPSLSDRVIGEFVERTAKIYAYAIAVPKRSVGIRATSSYLHFLLEINVTLTAKAHSPYCSLECLLKCNNSTYLNDFVELLQLENKLNNFQL